MKKSDNFADKHRGGSRAGRQGLGTLLVVLFVALFATKQVMADTWGQQVAQFIGPIDDVVAEGQSLFVSEITDSSSDRIYLPFTKRIHSVMLRSLGRKGIRLVSDPVDADVYLFTNYFRTQEGLSLQTRLVDQEGDERSNSVTTIASELLPQSWDRRTLKDIAYEIAGKLDRKLYGQRFNTVLMDLSGGESESEGFISDFTITMNDYMREELNKLPPIAIRQAADGTTRSHRLKGKFMVTGNTVRLNYSLVRDEDGHMVTVVSTQFPLLSVPQGMKMYPENRYQVADSFDEKGGLVERIPLAVWVNHEDAVYKDGDRLEVSVRPDVDAYVRIFYVQSDGMVCQIQPSSPGESSFLEAGVVYTVGGKDDDVELIVSDTTTGQETIKVFASTTPIEERHLSSSFIESVNFSCMNGDYRMLKDMMTRGLKMKRRIQPVDEIQILVK